MELVFLVTLLTIMVAALMSGFPVAFSLPGSAILAIALAALCGWLFENDTSAYFVQDGPVQWLTAGVTNFRSLYWEVERDTLIAVPLFIFMGIMLERSKIAEDLLVTMAQLFGPVPGGLGISVVFVGTLLAATTGIVGATVIAMGLISLPAMLRSNYSKSLATGTICASGTLGQIIPPSIVLIILADQLSNAADQASAIRRADYKESTGEFTMPSQLDVTSASAGDMFMGAFIPGLVLVGIYMLYILITALLRPRSAPPVPREGDLDRAFLLKVILALVPPLALIFAVLGSIIMGIATVNQAGAIGAVGAVIMGGYRLKSGQRGAYLPLFLAVAATAVLIFLLSSYDINIKKIQQTGDASVIAVAAVASTLLLVAIFWSLWRTYKIGNTLNGVMIETAKTTSMVFIILLGAAMLTAAFRAFGGEELVKEFLGGLPGGFWAQFIVVMVVIFLLGFFLDFIEIAVVVVPIVAPILLADPAANITAVWFGVMVGLNIQTSFLTPPFGFSLFYLRGVAPPSVKTIQIYKGAAAFIGLQLLGLTVAGYYPSLVNYLPTRIQLTADTAPPPTNPKLQFCLQNYLFEYYDDNEQMLRASIQQVRGLDFSALPEGRRQELVPSFDKALDTFSLIANIREKRAEAEAFESDYKPLHVRVRTIHKSVFKIEAELKDLEQDLRYARSIDNEAAIERLGTRIEELETGKEQLLSDIPDEWEAAHSAYKKLDNDYNRAVLEFRRNADNAYQSVDEITTMLARSDELNTLDSRVATLQAQIESEPVDTVIESIKALQTDLRGFEDTGAVVDALGGVRDALKDGPDRIQAASLLREARGNFEDTVEWRLRAQKTIGPELAEYQEAIRDSIGIRSQARLTDKQAKAITRCQAKHRDVSLSF